jgi:AraC family transcriptional regulator
MIETAPSSFQPARFETAAALLIAGLSQRYSPATASTIPQLWQQFVPYMSKVPQRVGAVDYGICYDNDAAGNFNYLCGFEVTELSSLPPELSHLHIPPQRYAVFAHTTHISNLRKTIDAIYRGWLPTAPGIAPAGMPNFIERYGPGFDPQAGQGDLEIWLPIKSVVQ